jgi:hypothetical protein
MSTDLFGPLFTGRLYSTPSTCSARIYSTRFIGAIGARCIGTIGMVYPGTLFHRRPRGIPMHSYENRSQIRALPPPPPSGCMTEWRSPRFDPHGARRGTPTSMHHTIVASALALPRARGGGWGGYGGVWAGDLELPEGRAVGNAADLWPPPAQPAASDQPGPRRGSQGGRGGPWIRSRAGHSPRLGRPRRRRSRGRSPPACLG